MELSDFTNDEIIAALRCRDNCKCIDCDKMVFCYSSRKEIEEFLADRLEEQIEPEDDWAWK